MTSFVVVSNDQKKRQVYIADFCQSQGIDMLDIAVVEKESVKNLNSIGIEDIKNIHSKIFLKPIKSDTKAVILDDAHLLTTEAQNALLKVLEEPPQNTLIVLSTDSTEQLLPTILSRCQIVSLSPTEFEFTDLERNEFEEFITHLSEMKIGERLKKAEELAKDKDEAIAWIGKLILVLRDKILNEARDTLDTHDTRDTLTAMQSLHTLLKTTNANPRFAIETTLLSL